eukprot:6977247-Alexandrium_andersonii.AAC.1
MSHVWCVHVRLHVQVALVSSLGQWSHGVKCVVLGHQGSFSVGAPYLDPKVPSHSSTTDMHIGSLYQTV